MPPATLVRWALPPIFARMISCRGPQVFFHRPMISTGTASGTEPVKTVHAVALSPGLIADVGNISTLPALGRGMSGCAVAMEAQNNTTVDAAKAAGYLLMKPLWGGARRPP